MSTYCLVVESVQLKEKKQIDHRLTFHTVAIQNKHNRNFHQTTSTQKTSLFINIRALSNKTYTLNMRSR